MDGDDNRLKIAAGLYFILICNWISPAITNPYSAGIWASNWMMSDLN